MNKVLARIYAWRYLILAAALCLTFYNLSFGPLKSSEAVGIAHLDESKLLDFFSHFHGRNERLANIKTRSKVYDEVLAQTSLYDFLKTNSLEDRCMAYFHHLTMSDPDWSVNPDERVSFNRDAFNEYESYREQTLKEAERKAGEAEKNGNPRPSLPTEEEIRSRFQSMRQTVLDDEQLLHDYVSHVRVFEKCFISPATTTKSTDKSFVKNQRNFLKNSVKYIANSGQKYHGKVFKQKLHCNEVENKVFPWLTNEYPVFTRWNGKTSYFPGNEGRSLRTRGCFLSEYKSRLNGKGIVMTIGDSHVNDASRFLRVLRHLGNTYPIQVVYYSRLSSESRANLVRAARDYFRGYPPQDIWFVNTEKSIDPKYLPKFSGFANKIMATMFNSFEEMILCDADSVLLKDPDYFFKLKKYINKGTMFYKDRAAGEYRSKADVTFFKKLLPSIEDSVVFNIPQTSNYTLGNEFYGGFSHYMESGVVVINRKKHFIQPLMMSVMNFYTTIVLRIYGDKELFWLSLAFAGDENYAFNDHFAAAIGEFTPEVERHKDIDMIKSFRSQEICSNHPAHVSDVDDQTLAWFNSGFRHCGNSLKSEMKWDDEFHNKKRYSWIKTIDEFKTFFKAPLRIRNAILPPFEPQHRLLKNVEHEPENSWVMTPYCYNYCWCAYSSIGGYYVENDETKDNSIAGKVLTFTPDQVKSFEEIGNVWIADFEWEK